ncbi:MAG TPA: alpha/beta hydrolase-fold protein [Candidatus Kapabacteria bacterium]|nr:alpha/beta hydrolase-fold protein [Candidatus Kapabacteria bacterium]
MENPIKGNIAELVESLRKAKTERSAKTIESIILSIIKGTATPVIDGDVAHFFYRSESGLSISVIGDWNRWQRDVDMLLPLHPKSSLRFFSKSFPIDARLSYRFAIADGDSINDPLNPKTLQEVFGNNTYLQMPAYAGVEYWSEPSKAVAKGKLIELAVKGNRSVADRIVQIYVPANLLLKGKQRFLYINDGAEAITVGKFTNVLDNLYHNEPNIAKAIVVFVPPVERHTEYIMSKQFSSWLSNDLLRQVERKLKVTSSAELRSVQGASLGGLLALHIGLNHYKKFRNIVAQSPSVWVDDALIAAQFAKAKSLPLRFYLHTGTINDAEEGSRRLLRILQAKGYDVIYRETNESHNWANWAGRYAEMLRWIGQ